MRCYRALLKKAAVTCQTAGCTTGCSHHGRPSDSARLPPSLGSLQAGSKRSASSDHATETHRRDQQRRTDRSPSQNIVTRSSPVTHRSSLWLWVRPAGSHGAHDASTGIHVEVPPGQDDLSAPVGLSRKLGGVRLESAAHWFTEINAEHGAERTQRGEAARRHLAQLDVAHRMSSGTAADIGRRDHPGTLHLHRLQLSPAPQQLRLHQLGVDGGPVRDRLTTLLQERTGHQLGLDTSPT